MLSGEPTIQPAQPASAALPLPLLESVPAPAYACDAEGRITGFNERAATLWGRRPKLNGLTERYCGSEALLAPDGSPLPHEACPTALALSKGSAHQGSEAVIVRPDGSRRTVLYYATPVYDERAAVIGATAVLIDVTEREELQRSAREALQDREANFRGFFDSVAVGAVQANGEGRFVGVNDRYCEITGYSREELLTMSPFDLDHPDDREADVGRVKQALSHPSGIYHTEKRYVRKDGSIRWVHVAVNFVRDPVRRTVQSAAIVMDISERKRAEEALQQADRLKDEYLATLAHELRNPLAPLRSAAELLRDAGAEESRWCRNVIDRQVSHLTRLIDDLLDVSRITRDKLELRKERIELADVINGAIEASRPLLERCEQTLTTRVPSEPVYLHGDLVRLTQVFTNLLTNAAKFTESAGAIRLVAVADGANVEVRVEDNGVGIARDEIARVFDKFYQSPHRGKRALGGLGIGLSLAQRLVELHGGSIEARSAGLSHGSEFVVRLPVAAADAPTVVPADAAARAPSGGKRIMIVDDNVDGADALGRLLGLMGHETIREYDGQAALKRAAEFCADVIFLDLCMPGIGGVEVCRRLREQPAPKRPRIVALTGWGRVEDLARTKQAGFDAHLVKPVERAALERVLSAAEMAEGEAQADAAHPCMSPLREIVNSADVSAGIRPRG